MLPTDFRLPCRQRLPPPKPSYPRGAICWRLPPAPAASADTLLLLPFRMLIFRYYAY